MIAAQQQAVDLRLEGQEIAAKYGGPQVTPQMRRQALLEKSNLGAPTTTAMQSGSIAELRRRNMELGTQYASIEQARRVEGGMAGRTGIDLDADQKNLQTAQQDQIKTIRELIKLEEQELKLIEQKNKLEKDSLESLLAGDIEKFMKDQAAVGATAAIATGNQSLMNMFGAEALGDAFKDIQRQQQAGVQSLYGVGIGGAGGLGEQAAAAGLRAVSYTHLTLPTISSV